MFCSVEENFFLCVFKTKFKRKTYYVLRGHFLIHLWMRKLGFREVK